MRENPYYDYSTVRDLDMFFGRTEILQTIFSACKQRQCFSLVGTRKIGKSSILSHMQSPELQKRLGVQQDLSRHIFMYIDMRNYLQHELNDFFREIYTQIAAHAPRDMELSATGEKGHELFTRSLQDLHAAGYRLVLIMDVFDKVEDEHQFGPGFFSFLRAPSTKGWVSYITASLKPLYQISPVEAASSPFFDSFIRGSVGALSEEEALHLIAEPAERVGLPFSKSDITWVREVAGRHPFFIQVASHHLFREKSKQEEGGQLLDYQRVSQSVYEELAPHFESIWNGLSQEQQRELRQETRQTSGGWQKLEELSESALFRNNLREMQRHVHKKFQMGQQTIRVEDVRNALDKLDDRAFLQTSPLAELPSIVAQSEGTRTSANRRGLLVQELLKQGFERMKPEGNRTDTAPEWRLYNTLYYRYFVKGVSNQQAAARLAISLRQFYRDRDQAIQTLIQELLDLDADADAEA